MRGEERIMKKNLIVGIIIAVLVVAYNALCLVLGDLSRTGTFINLAFGDLAFLLVILFSFALPKGRKWKFLGISGAYISFIYLAVQLIVSFVFILIRFSNLTVILVIEILVTAIYLVLFLVNALADNATVEDDKRMAADMGAQRALAQKAASVLRMVQGNDAYYKKIETVVDALNSMQLTRAGADVSAIDGAISYLLDKLADLVRNGKYEECDSVIQEIKMKIADRNDALRNAQY